MYEDFIKAIKEKKIVVIEFVTVEAGDIRKRRCIPFDFGPSRRNIDPNPDRYHFYDLDSPDGEHNLSIVKEQLKSLEVTDENFEPGDYVNWNPNWFIDRDWGDYS